MHATTTEQIDKKQLSSLVTSDIPLGLGLTLVVLAFVFNLCFVIISAISPMLHFGETKSELKTDYRAIAAESAAIHAQMEKDLTNAKYSIPLAPTAPDYVQECPLNKYRNCTTTGTCFPPEN